MIHIQKSNERIDIPKRDFISINISTNLYFNGKGIKRYVNKVYMKIKMCIRDSQKGIYFALSNNLKYDNPYLDEWKDKYNVHYLNGDYSNCNYHKIDRSKDCEVLITNY